MEDFDGEGVSSSTSGAVPGRSAQPAPPAVASTVKLPAFWQSDPAAWFQHVEAIFHLRGVDADDARYYLVVAALDEQSTRRAMSLLRDPPRRGRYAALKQLLLQRFSLSAAERADKILSFSGLGDSSALELMDDMLTLLGSDEGGFLFPHVFLRQLPPQVRAVLANSPRLTSGDYRGLAEEADRVLLATRRFTVQGTEQVSQQAEETAAVSAVRARTRRRGSSMCFYHQRFGVRAKRCIPPCTFETSGNAVAGAQ